MMRILLAAAMLVPVSAFAADLSVSDAFSRATPGAAPGVAYLTIHGGDAADRLVGVSSPRAPKVEMHSMAMQGSVMQMREVEAIDVPANGTVKLAPGGLHLMLLGMTAPLKAGETVPLTLRFEKAGSKVVEVPVGAIGATGPAASNAPAAPMPGMPAHAH